MKKREENLSLLVLIIICFVGMALMCKVYPFGENVYAFATDGYHGTATLFYMWDVFHGDRSLLYSFASGYGTNMLGILSHCGAFSPINLILLFIPRSWIVPATVWMAMIRIILAGFSMKYFLEKVFAYKLNTSWRLLFSLMYCFSSWFIHYLEFPQWMDVAILMPYLLSNLFGMFSTLKKINKVAYSLSLTLLFLINAQLSFSAIILILIISAFWLFYNSKDSKRMRQQKIFNLGIYTVLAIAIGAFILVPVAYQIRISSRSGTGGIAESILEIIDACKLPDQRYTGEKMLIFSSSIVSVGIIAVCFIRKIVSKIAINKDDILILLLGFFVTLPVLIEAVHYIWLGGRYICFPLRHGQFIVFVLIYIAAIMISSFENGKVNQYINVIVWIAFALIIVKQPVNNEIKTGNYVDERDMYYYEECLNSMYQSPLVRYKNISFSDNESVVSGLSSGSNYLHLNTYEMLRTNAILGYKQSWTAMSDKGGTRFTDAILGYKYNLDKADEVVLNPINNEYPFGFFIENPEEIIELAKKENLFLVQNEVSKEVIGAPLFEILVNGEKGNEFHFDGRGKSLYMYIEDADEHEIISYSVNNEKFDYQFAIKYIGQYTGGVDINIDNKNNLPVFIASMDDELFESNVPENVITNINVGNRMIEFDVNNNTDDEKILFLPLTNQKGWTCEVNGEIVDIQTVVGSFMGIHIPQNKESKIAMSFFPRFMWFGIIISILGVIGIFVCVETSVLDKMATNLVLSLSYYTYMIICSLLLGITLILSISTLIFKFK